MPRPLVNAVRMKRYGDPWPGGWMAWPVKWIMEVEMAEDAFTSLTEVSRAMSQLDGEALEKWRAAHPHYIETALKIETLLADEDENG